MKKNIFLSLFLLLSFLTQTNLAHNPLEELASKFNDGTLTDTDIDKIAATLKQDITKTAKHTDAIVLTFRIEKGEYHNKQTWQDIVQQSVNIIEKAETLTKQENDTEIIDDIFDFVKNTVTKSGDKNDIHGEFSINLENPDNWACVEYTN